MYLFLFTLAISFVCLQFRTEENELLYLSFLNLIPALSAPSNINLMYSLKSEAPQSLFHNLPHLYHYFPLFFQK